VGEQQVQRLVAEHERGTLGADVDTKAGLTSSVAIPSRAQPHRHRRDLVGERRSTTASSAASSGVSHRRSFASASSRRR
jgi:hypothetical protein